MVAGSGAEFDVAGTTGNPIPTHLHDDNALTTGTVTVTPFGTAAAVSGWFKAQDGAVIPGVTMSNRVLTGTGLYVNGKPYSGGEVRDWYFLTKVANVSTPFCPNKRRAGVSRPTVSAGHHCHHNNGDQEPSKNEEDANAVEVRHCIVEEADHSAGNPRHNNVGDKDVPWLGDEVWVL